MHLPDGADHPGLFLAGPSGVSFGKPEIAIEGEAGLSAAVPVRLSGKDRELKGKPIVVTIRAKGRSMETTLAFD